MNLLLKGDSTESNFSWISWLVNLKKRYFKHSNTRTYEEKRLNTTYNITECKKQVPLVKMERKKIGICFLCNAICILYLFNLSTFLRISFLRSVVWVALSECRIFEPLLFSPPHIYIFIYIVSMICCASERAINEMVLRWVRWELFASKTTTECLHIILCVSVF